MLAYMLYNRIHLGSSRSSRSSLSQFMDGILVAVSLLHTQLDHLKDLLGVLPNRADFIGITNGIIALKGALQQEFEAPRRRGCKRSLGEHLKRECRLRQSVHRSRAKTKSLDAKLFAATTSKISGRIQDEWFIKVGLAAPTVSRRTLA